MGATTFTLGAHARLDVDVGLGVYSADLLVLVDKLEDMGKQSTADSCRAEASMIEEDLRPRIRKHAPELDGPEIVTVRNALGRYVKRLQRMARGLEKLYEGEMAQQLRAKAEHVTEHTLPLFSEQTQLGVADGK